MMACALLVIDEETDIDVSTVFERAMSEEQGMVMTVQEDTAYTIIWHFKMTGQETDLGVLRERYGHLILDWITYKIIKIDFKLY